MKCGILDHYLNQGIIAEVDGSVEWESYEWDRDWISKADVGIPQVRNLSMPGMGL